MVQTDRLPKLEINFDADPIPELIADEPSVEEILDGVGHISAEEPTTEVEALAEPQLDAEAAADADMNYAPEFVDEAPQLAAGAGQFEFYGQIFELHVQQLVKLKGSGGTRRSKCWCATHMRTMNSAWRPIASCRTYTTPAPTRISTASSSSSWPPGWARTARSGKPSRPVSR